MLAWHVNQSTEDVIVALRTNLKYPPLEWNLAKMIDLQREDAKIKGFTPMNTTRSEPEIMSLCREIDLTTFGPFLLEDPSVILAFQADLQTVT